MTMPKTLVRTLFVAACVASAAAFAWADDGEGPLRPDSPQGVTVQQIIDRFASREKEFKEARENYIYRQTVKVQTVDGDTVDGEFQQVVDVTYDANHKRQENVIFAPQSSLRRISMSREDYQDINNLLPFVLTSDEIGEYNVGYAGQQTQDDIDTYVFDISPKHIEKGQRYFEGRIWVDKQDFQIVKTHGQTVPQIRDKKQENLFPKFTTYREQIDGKYWFPTYTRADDTLHFRNQDVRIREIIKYTNYQYFGVSTKQKVTFQGTEVKGDKKDAPKDEGKDK
jgi:hypothetical protein